MELKIAVFIRVLIRVLRKKFFGIEGNNHLTFPNLIDTTALVGLNVQLGIGNILMPYAYTADTNNR